MTPLKWTGEKNKRLVRLFAAGWKANAIAGQMQISPRLVRDQLIKLGLTAVDCESSVQVNDLEPKDCKNEEVSMTSFQTVAKMALEETGLRWNRIAGFEKNQEIFHARWAICWAMREGTGYSLSMVARRLNCDHTSVLYGHKKACELRESNPSFKDLTDRLMAAIPDKEVPE